MRELCYEMAALLYGQKDFANRPDVYITEDAAWGDEPMKILNAARTALAEKP